METFDTLIQKSYGYDSQQMHISSDWAVVRHLYQSNYVRAIWEKNGIPKIIHQIWLGSLVPDKFKRYMETWKELHPTWEYKLWTDKEAKKYMSENEVYQQVINNGMKSDMLRYKILREQGGVYVDTDFECIRPLDDLLYLNFFTGISYDPKLCLYIGLIASVPQHPIMIECSENVLEAYPGNKASIIMNLSGPQYFTRCFMNNVKLDTKGVVAFPTDFFYPFPNNKIDKADPYLYITENTYALHHWAISWIIRKKQ